MARPRIAPSVLADKGVPLTLAGGLEVTLCFSFKALMLLEERYGSIEAAAALMSGAPAAATTIPAVADSSGVVAKTGQAAKPFATVAGILACGLAHEVTPADDDGRPLDNPDVLGDYLETDKIEVYSEAIAEAFAKAFPAADPSTPAGEQPEAPTGTTEEGSRGPSGTGSLESGSTLESASSGA